jgi:hypothetical protein
MGLMRYVMRSMIPALECFSAAVLVIFDLVGAACRARCSLCLIIFGCVALDGLSRCVTHPAEAQMSALNGTV